MNKGPFHGSAYDWTLCLQSSFSAEAGWILKILIYSNFFVFLTDTQIGNGDTLFHENNEQADTAAIDEEAIELKTEQQEETANKEDSVQVKTRNVTSLQLVSSFKLSWTIIDWSPVFIHKDRHHRVIYKN